jgi:hypothetical protein
MYAYTDERKLAPVHACSVTLYPRTQLSLTVFCQCADGEVLRDGDEAGRAVASVQGPYRQKQHRHSLPGRHLPRGCTDKKENQIFLMYKEIQSGAVAKSYMRKGFL